MRSISTEDIHRLMEEWYCDCETTKEVASLYADLFYHALKGMHERMDELEVYREYRLSPDELKEKLYELESIVESDLEENYTNGYRWGHRNGQKELLKHILGISNNVCVNSETDNNAAGG